MGHFLSLQNLLGLGRITLSNRKLRRRKDALLKKELKKRTKSVEAAMSTLPEKCDECSTPFDRQNKSLLDKWRLAVYDDGRINLVCPDCVPQSVKNIV